MKPRVMKFGGTSMGSPERIASVAAIVGERAATRPVVVVVSAMAGVTDALDQAARAAARGEIVYAEASLDAIAERHRAAAVALAPPYDLERVMAVLHERVEEARSLLRGVSLVRDCSRRVLDAVLATGELLSAPLLAAALCRRNVLAFAVDTRELIETDDTFGNARADLQRTTERVRERLSLRNGLPVATGFIGATADSATTTLGRGGSDYSATILGVAVDADAIEIWTDVDGVMSADPRLVPQAFALPALTYTELMELSHFGARVVYPPSVQPARERGIPLFIRNTLNPSHPGTRVTATGEEAEAPATGPVRGISSIHDVALCRLEGAGMVGVPGIASRLFGALARERISVILISQASSEHSICFALEPAQAKLAGKLIDAEFEVERRAGVVDPLIIETGFSVIAAVGEAMRETPGIAGRLFDVLGRNGVNVRAIAQGSSELNISLVVNRADEARALRLIHDAFFFPRTRVVHVFVAGAGRVGAALLDQLAAEQARLGERAGLRLIVSGIARRSTAVLNSDGIPLADWRDLIAGATRTPAEVMEAALRSPHAHRVFVDVTASADVAAVYEDMLRAGAAIVCANKIALSGPMESWRRLREAARKGNGIYIETTVGAALPVLRPLADLVATGDVVERIEGVLSGTLSYIFAHVSAGMPFSEAVREAHARGLTEPDPREDLSGRDVARKLLILAREAGFEIEAEQVHVAPVLSGEPWDSYTTEQFLRELPTADPLFNERAARARAEGRRLVYAGEVRSTGAHVRLAEVERTHPFADLPAGDNAIAVTSARYCERPLVIRGPGAGPEVTAAGVFADIIRAALEAR